MASRSPDPMYLGWTREEWEQYHAEQANRPTRSTNYPGTDYVDSGDNPQSEIGQSYQAAMQAKHAESSGGGVHVEGDSPSPQREDIPMTPAEEISSEHEPAAGTASDAEPIFVDITGRSRSTTSILRSSGLLLDPAAKDIISATDYDRMLLHKNKVVCLMLATSIWEFYGVKK